MNETWQQIREFYSRDGIFTCGQSGSREEDACEIEVTYILVEPASEAEIQSLQKQIPLSLTPNYCQFLRFANGALCFSQQSKDSYESGFVLYSTEILLENHNEVVSWLKDMIIGEDEFMLEEEDEDDEAEKQQILHWLKNILVVGEELQSGNYLVIDYNRNPDGPDHPIIFLDHEVPFSCTVMEDDDPIIGPTVEDVLLRAAEDPAHFLMHVLGSTATYSDGKTNIQWYPKTYRQQ